jgi:FKBP-type peptidyl-prolyl cis-trans isomerase SlpA
MSDPIGVGSRVVMHYAITLPDGTIADSSFQGEPLSFTMGDDSLIPGLELALYGLGPGGHQTLTLTPDQTFGYPDPANVQEMPLSDFPDELAPEEGQIIEFSTPGGDSVPGSIVEVAEETVKVDFNHPLSGLELVFTVEILSVRNGPGPDVPNVDNP